MVAKITVGTSLYGALAYNGMKVNEGEGKLLAGNKVFDDGSGRVDIARAEQDFKRYMPENVRTRNKVIHISLNPHPDDRLTDMEMESLAREYLEKLGYGDQPYLIFKHEDINRHHLHIVSVNVDENGRRLNKDFIHRRSKRITTELERKYGLHPADRRQHRNDNSLRKVDASQGDVKRQVSNTVKAVMATYKFRTMGEYRALLSLYNVTVEEARGMVNGREYHGLVYSATDDGGNKVGNPFKASCIGKSVGYEAVLRRFEYPNAQIRDKRLADMTRKTVAAVLDRTYRKDEFVALLKAKGVDVVFRHTDGAHLRGDLHRPPHGLCAERLPAGQGIFRQRLAGALHFAVCGHAADAVHPYTGRTAGGSPYLCGTRREPFHGLGLAWRRRIGRTGGRSRLRARTQTQAEETPEGFGIINYPSAGHPSKGQTFGYLRSDLW